MQLLQHGTYLMSRALKDDGVGLGGAAGGICFAGTQKPDRADKTAP